MENLITMDDLGVPFGGTIILGNTHMPSRFFQVTPLGGFIRDLFRDEVGDFHDLHLGPIKRSRLEEAGMVYL